MRKEESKQATHDAGKHENKAKEEHAKKAKSRADVKRAHKFSWMVCITHNAQALTFGIPPPPPTQPLYHP